jgi:2'-5' RNA ligase
MRLFVAVELDEGIRRQAGRIAVQLGEAFGPAARRSVTWVPASNMHLTLRFLGEVEERRAAEVAARVSQLFTTAAFRLAVGGLGAFPPSGPPRVIWLGLTAGTEPLVRLHEELEGRLERLGFAREGRPFRAHLTLGRVKGGLGPGARAALSAIPAAALGACAVEHVTLFESRLSPRGAVHTALARGPLA